jgi:myo-inositol-1(or 4)-monophosphatase
MFLHESKTMNPDTTLEQVLAIARHAGTILLRNLRQPIERTTKSSDIDIVTAADKETEQYIVCELIRLFPEHHIIGEEGGGMGAPRSAAQYLWLVDPLDGTTNFASGIPHFSVSLALCDAAMEPLLGVVYDPNRAEAFYAMKGRGAYLNGERLHVSQTTQLSDAILCSGFPYDRRTNPDNNLRQWAAFTPIARDMRRYGSAALDLCYVACARWDGFWERSLNPWDTAAGMLIAREAGAVVTDYEGGMRPQDGPDGRYLAANPALHPLMQQIIAESYRS